jgi:hypothetical protein
MKKGGRVHLFTSGAVGLTVLALALASCSKKEEPKPVVQQPTPTTVPATTLPPVPTPTPVPTPPPAWREARWGMKKAEVLAAFPKEAQKLAEPVPFVQPQEGSLLKPGVGEVVIPSYQADGADFRVLFGFTGDALDRISMSALKPKVGMCEGVEAAVTERHRTTPQRNSTGTSLRGEEIVWRMPDQTIVLGCAGVKSLGFVTVTLDHVAPAAPSASPAP